MLASAEVTPQVAPCSVLPACSPSWLSPLALHGWLPDLPSPTCQEVGLIGGHILRRGQGVCEAARLSASGGGEHHNAAAAAGNKWMH